MPILVSRNRCLWELCLRDNFYYTLFTRSSWLNELARRAAIC